MASLTTKRKTGCGSNSDGSNASSPSVATSLNNSISTPYYPHLTANAPKNGVVIPNRVFVGGIASTTTEAELTAFFSKYGQVKDVKIIVDRGGISKGYGFVTFDSEEEANKLQLAADDVNFQGRRLNIAAAIKKQVCILQPYNRSFDASSTSPPMPPNVYFHNGIPYTYHNGMAFFSSGNPPTNAIAPVQAHPESVSMYQGTFGPPHGSTAAPSFGPTMMYHPCPNPPPPVYLPTQQYTYQPLPFDSFYQVASQSSGIMFSAGAGPTSISSSTSAQNSSLVAAQDSGSTSQSVQLIPTQTSSMYAAPHILHDVYYSAQSMYPMGTAESVTHYSEVQAVDSPHSNMSAEGSSCSKTEPESVACSWTTPSGNKQNETQTPQTATTPVVSWLHCSEQYDRRKSINDKQMSMNEISHEQSTTAAVFPVTMYNPVFPRPSLPRHPHPSAVNGYHENHTRVRNFIPYMYSVETVRRSSNSNVPKPQSFVHHNNNNNIAHDNYSPIKSAEVSMQVRNVSRSPRHPKSRPMPLTPHYPNRFQYTPPPYVPRFPYITSQQPPILPFPPPYIAASRRFPNPNYRRPNTNIPVSTNVSTHSSNNYNSSNENSNISIHSRSTTNSSNNYNNNNNNNNNNNHINKNNNVGSNGEIINKFSKSVTTTASSTKVEPESGTLAGAGDAPLSSRHSNVTSATAPASGPTPLELSHQMQKLST